MKPHGKYHSEDIEEDDMDTGFYIYLYYLRNL